MNLFQQYPQLSNLNIPPSQLTEESATQLFLLFQQKQKIISTLDADLIKAKAEEVKNKKLIQTLQQKITQLSPHFSNTGSQFMMPSQFRVNFDDFMKNDFANLMAPLLQVPKAYVRYGKELLTHIYSNIKEIIDDKITKVSEVLNLRGNELSIYMSLLKILQQNWKDILLAFGPVKLSYNNIEIKKIQQSDEFENVQKEFGKLCIYMLLQQNPWELLIPEHKIEEYVKKSYECIDGWVKEGNSIIVVVEGLKRGQFVHPNLKNYVIPYLNQDDFPFEQESGKKSQSSYENQLKPKNIGKKDSFKNDSDFFCAHKTRNKTKSKLKNSQHQRKEAPKQRGLHNKQNEQSKISVSERQVSKQNKKRRKMKSRYCLVSDPSFDEIMQLPVKFMKGEFQEPIKKSNSRKESIGRIMGEQPNKQNLSRNKMFQEGKKTRTERIHQKSKDDDRIGKGTNFKRVKNKYLNL